MAVEQPTRRNKIDKKIGYYVPITLIIGVVFDWALGSANWNAILGAGIGALIGTFLGWFIVVAFFQNKSGNK